MPTTRAMSGSDNLVEMIEMKFNELRNEVATKRCIDELKNLILEQNVRIEKLESHISILQNTVDLLKRDQDESEQYSRRLCLRIEGIEPAKDEKAEECFEKVKKLFSSLNVDVPDLAIDRAHRIGEAFINNKKESVHPMIVKFTTWRHRSMVYRARDKSKSAKQKIRLDLTKSRYNILKEARKLILTREGKPTELGVNGPVNFLFVDINCRLVAKMKDQSYLYYETVEQFRKIVGFGE